MLAQQSVGFIPVYLKINRCQHDIPRNPSKRPLIPHMRIFFFKYNQKPHRSEISNTRHII